VHARAPAGVVVVGSCIVDVALYADRIPVAGEPVVARDAATAIGGKASNQAIGVRRLGVPSALVALVGTDAWADAALTLWRREGVDVAHVVRDVGQPTGMGIVVVRGDGENVTVTAPAASGRLGAADVDAAAPAIAAARVVVTHLNAPAATLVRALASARAVGCTTVLNASPLGELPDALAGLADVLVVNRLEAAALTGVGDPEAAAGRLADRAGGAVVVTLGADGAVLADAGETWPVPPFAADAVDATGAGDAFVAGLAGGLAARDDVAAAARYGCAVAALSVARRGTWASFPTADAVDALLGRG
jgi:ribokinase